MNKFKSDDLIDYRPELSAAAQAHYELMRRSFEPRLSFLREFRTILGYSQVEIADVLGVTQSAVSKMEGREDASFATLSRLAAAKGKRLRLVIESDNDEPVSIAVP